MARKNGAHTSTAVMSRRRAKDDNEGLTDEERLWKQLDHFCTPPWGARAGLERARALWQTGERGLHLVEPAAGRGHIATPAREYFELVEGFDVHDYGAGFAQRDWMDDGAWGEGECCDVVLTNPPFQLAEEFVIRGLQRARLGVALLLRLAVLEGVDRYSILAGEKAQLTQHVVFSERLPMTLGSWDPDASSATAYAWFFWSKVHDPQPVDWFPPGTRDRLWMRDDPARFGKLTPMPLFERSVAEFYDEFDVI
jgi:hypothetical protein